ncbi:MAG TPA: hypothetical protein VFZ23_07540, partial [Pyrinomonadaceae bacterium]
MNLIVNPLAGIETVDVTGDLIVGGPVPGRGMKYLQVSTEELPRLHALLSELSRIGLANLDIKTDLENGEELELLRDHGILIDEDNLPERPLFSCMLDDVEPDPSFLSTSLVVNPNLEFQPFDLTKFRSWMQDKHLSPHHATVWVTDPRTNIRWGYWLTPAEAELIQRIRPGSGDRLPEIDPFLMAKLHATDILVDAEEVHSSQTSEAIRLAAEDFGRDRYAVVTDIIPAAQLRSLQDYFRRYVEQGFMKFGDNQVDRRFAEHGEP